MPPPRPSPLVTVSVPATASVAENVTVQVCAKLAGGSADTVTSSAISVTLVANESTPGKESTYRSLSVQSANFQFQQRLVQISKTFQ